MKFKINKDDLLKSLKLVGLKKINELLIIVTDKVEFIAFDGEVYISVDANAEISEQGEVFIDYSLLNKFFNNFKDELIEFNLVDKKLIIESEKTKTKFNLSDLSFEYQELKCDNTTKFEYDKLLKRIAFAASKDEYRLELSSVFFGDNIVATDSYRLVAGGKSEFNFMMPINTVNEIIRITEILKEDYSIGENNKTVYFESGNVKLMSKTIDSEYPNYKQIIPEKFNITFDVDRKEFINYLELNKVFLKGDNKVNFKFIKDKFIIFSESANGECKNEFDIENDIELDIGFNCYYLLEGLNNFTTEKVTLKLTDMHLLIDSEEEDYFYLICSIR